MFDLRLDLDVPALLLSATRASTKGAWPAGGRVTIASCRPDPREALRQGLWEIVISYETQCLWPDDHKQPGAAPYDPGDPRQGWASFWPLWLHYLDPAHAGAFGWLFDASLPAVSLDDIPALGGEGPAEHLGALVDKVAGAGLTRWLVDMTLPEITALGRVAVRVVAPGALDVSFGRQSVRFGSPRLEEVAARLGRGGLGPGERNPHPHPAT